MKSLTKTHKAEAEVIPQLIETKEFQKLLRIAKEHKAKVSSYPEELKQVAIAMRATGMTMMAIAKTFGVSEASIHAWVHDPRNAEYAVSELSEGIKKQMAGRMLITGNTILSSITDKDLEKATLYQKTGSISTLVGTSRLLTGESTENVEMIYSRKDNAGVRVAKMEREIRERKEEMARQRYQ